MKVSLKYQQKLFSVIVFKINLIVNTIFFVGRVGGGGEVALVPINVFRANNYRVVGYWKWVHF